MNEKEELLANLEYTKEILAKNDQITVEWNRIHQKPVGIGIIGWIVITILVITILASAELYFEIIYHTAPLKNVVPYGIFTPFIGFVFNIVRENERAAANEDRVKQLKNMYNENVALLNENSIIPPKYRYTWAVEHIESYLLNQRADTLRDSLNLLEIDIRHSQQVAQLKVIQAQNEAIYKQGRSIAAIGIINMFKD